MKHHQLTRLFIDQAIKENFTAQNVIALSNIADIHYLLNVMRKKNGQQLLIFNDQDGEYLAEIISIQPKKLTLKVISLYREPFIERELNLIFAPIKHPRLSYLIEKATELGVTRFFPIHTQHSVVDKINIAKWNIYIKEAAEQSGRLSLPKIEKLQSLENFLINWPQDLEIIFCNEQEKKFALRGYTSNTSSLMIGPEGGFSDHEISLIKNKSYITSVHLGPRILRTETAAIVGLALL